MTLLRPSDGDPQIGSGRPVKNPLPITGYLTHIWLLYATRCQCGPHANDRQRDRHPDEAGNYKDAITTLLQSQLKRSVSSFCPISSVYTNHSNFVKGSPTVLQAEVDTFLSRMLSKSPFNDVAAAAWGKESQLNRAKAGSICRHSAAVAACGLW